jgi:uncharacterized RDD family membrane protein YckC
MNAIAQASAAPASGSRLDNRRVLAALIDLAVVAVGAAAILAAAGVLGESVSEVGAPLALVSLGWALYYYFACESGNGQTLGKRVMRIRVVRADGEPAGMREIGIRTALRVIDMQFVYLVGLIVMMATGERRGRLGDLAAGTMIVAADEPAAATPAPAPAEEASRVPIAESGPAFEPAPEEAPEAKSDEPDVATTAMQELAADVSALTSAPDREVEEEPEAEAAEAEAGEAEQPATEAPAAEEPDAEQPASHEPDVEQPASQEPDAEQPASDEPAAEQPASDEPAAEEPASDEPGAEEPAPEEPASDEPDVEVLSDEADAEDADGDERVAVKSVETISAIDLVMDDSRRDS